MKRWNASYKSTYPSHYVHATATENTATDMLHVQKSAGGGKLIIQNF